MRTAALLIVLSTASTAYAASFAVTSVDAEGPGSLTQAVADLSTSPDSENQIVFAPEFPLGGEVQLEGRQLVLTHGIVDIDGGGRSPRLVRDNSNANSLLRAAADLTELTVRGVSFDGSGGENAKACLDREAAEGASSLVLEDVEFSGCRRSVNVAEPVRGGAVEWLVSSGTVDVVASTFTGNSVQNTSVGTSSRASGGAISSTVAVTISDSAFNENQAMASEGAGSGAVSAASLVVSNSSFSSNGAAANMGASGGAISGTDGLQISESTFRANRVTAFDVSGLANGGALSAGAADSRVSIVRSRFIGNQSVNESGGSGGVYATLCITCEVLLEDNYFEDNSARFGSVVRLTGFWVSAQTWRLSNNTFVSNVGESGVVSVTDGALTLENNTFFDNEAPSFGTGALVLWGGQGLTLNATNNLLFGGAVKLCSIGGNISVGDSAGNLIGDSSCNPLQPSAPVVADVGIPALVLAGPAETLSFPVGSPVRDGGDDQFCTEFDAAGRTRPQDANGDGIATCDVGAYEHDFPSIFRSGFEAAEWVDR